MRVKIFYIIFLILLVFSVLANKNPLHIYNAECEKDGSISVTFNKQVDERIYTEDIDIKAVYIGNLIVKSEFNVEGTWDYDFIKKDETIFTSEEVLFKDRGEYLITADYLYNNKTYSITRKIGCPGFEFSCKLLSVYIDDCKNINNERFEAKAKIYGLGDVTKEDLSLENNIKFIVHAEKSFEDKRGKFSGMGSLPKDTEISNPEYGFYYFNLTWDNKIEKFVIKFTGINYIEGGCVNYPGISLYSYKECEDIVIKEKKEEKPVEENKTEPSEEQNTYTGQIIKDQDIKKELERNIGTKQVKSRGRLVILFITLGLCILGAIYIILKRNFNKESNF